MKLVCYNANKGVKFMIEITYFVHGTTQDNTEKKSTGWMPGELTEKGIQQGIDLAHTIKDDYFDVVFCSDLKRAIESAKLNFYNRDIEIIRDERLRECNYGDYNGQDSKLANYSTHITDRFPNGECLLDVEKRMRSFISYLKENYDNKKVAIVCHKAPQLAFDVITNNLTWEEALANDWRIEHKWQPGWKYIIK